MPTFSKIIHDAHKEISDSWGYGGQCSAHWVIRIPKTGTDDVRYLYQDFTKGTARVAFYGRTRTPEGAATVHGQRRAVDLAKEVRGSMASALANGESVWGYYNIEGLQGLDLERAQAVQVGVMVFVGDTTWPEEGDR